LPATLNKDTAMRYTLLASMTAAALAFGMAQAGAQTKTSDPSPNVTKSDSEKMNPQGDLGAGVNSSASSQAHSSGPTSSGRSSAPADSPPSSR
jgi:hypothetical protein